MGVSITIRPKRAGKFDRAIGAPIYTKAQSLPPVMGPLDPSQKAKAVSDGLATHPPEHDVLGVSVGESLAPRHVAWVEG